MIEIYGKLNRFRGSSNKLLGIIAMWIILVIPMIPVLWLRPDVLFLNNIAQCVIFATLSFVGFLCMYKWFWGSAVFPQMYDTRKEVADGELLAIAKDYADAVTGYTYDDNLTEESAIISWKEQAHKAVCVFRYMIGYLSLSVAALNPLTPFLGLRGLGVAAAYRKEYDWSRHYYKTTGKGDEEILHRAEINVGRGDCYFLIAFFVLNAIQTGLMLWLMK